MSRTDAYLLILGMVAVTYIPRALPAFLMDRLALSGRVKRPVPAALYGAIRPDLPRRVLCGCRASPVRHCRCRGCGGAGAEEVSPDRLRTGRCWPQLCAVPDDLNTMPTKMKGAVFHDKDEQQNPEAGGGSCHSSNHTGDHSLPADRNHHAGSDRIRHVDARVDRLQPVLMVHHLVRRRLA